MPEGRVAAEPAADPLVPLVEPEAPGVPVYVPVFGLVPVLGDPDVVPLPDARPPLPVLLPPSGRTLPAAASQQPLWPDDAPGAVEPEPEPVPVPVCADANPRPAHNTTAATLTLRSIMILSMDKAGACQRDLNSRCPAKFPTEL